MRGFTDALTFRSANAWSNFSYQMQKVVRAGNIVVLDEKNPHIRNTSRWSIVIKAGREQRSVHNGRVDCLDKCQRSSFHLTGASEWPNRFRQACKTEQQYAKGGESEMSRIEEIQETGLSGRCRCQKTGCQKQKLKVNVQESWRRPDWRVQSRSSEQVDAEREGGGRSTRPVLRDWCTHCMMGRGRTHHHVPKQQSEDQSRRPPGICGRLQYFMNMNSVVNSHTISEQSCIAVKEDRDQNITCSVAVKKGVEESWID